MRAVDTHAHLDFPEYNERREELIKQLEREQIGVLTIATDEESVKNVVQLSRDNTLVWGAIGLHPCEVNENSLEKLPSLLGQWKVLLAENPKIKAIGEIGLDYFHNKDHVNAQKAVLRELLNFAEEHELPVIFHCRDAYGDLLTLLEQYPRIQGVVHCYSSTPENAQRFLDLGLHLSFTGMITYPKNQELRDLIADLPLEKIMIETDSPFLAPQPIRGQTNDPLQVIEVAKTIAQIKELQLEEVLAQTTQTAVKLFKLEVE